MCCTDVWHERGSSGLQGVLICDAFAEPKLYLFSKNFGLSSISGSFAKSGILKMKKKKKNSANEKKFMGTLETSLTQGCVGFLSFLVYR